MFSAYILYYTFEIEISTIYMDNLEIYKIYLCFLRYFFSLMIFPRL